MPNDPSIGEFAKHIQTLDPKGRRRLVALAGPPASGKSTLADALVKNLDRMGACAVLVPMDGFHLDNRILTKRGLLHRKGAPETFDANGFVKLIQSIAAEEEVFFPVFDRDIDCSIAGAGVVSAVHDTVVVEGNYLLLSQDPWSKLHDLWDCATFISASIDVLRERLIQRWLKQGLTKQAAIEKTESNDLLNVETVLNNSDDKKNRPGLEDFHPVCRIGVTARHT